MGQIFFVDLFLGGMFTSYGLKVVEQSNLDPEERGDPMEYIFPKGGGGFSWTSNLGIGAPLGIKDPL